jgi:cell division protein YceG involved in septum cleavage|tara:strand:- start:6056 stop:6535 length:480 start_codon:yes stop_codon:yes gene_type:complete
MKIAMIMIVVMAVVLGGFYWYYQDSQEKIAVLQGNNAKLEVSVQTQKETIEQHLEDAQKAHSIVAETNLKFAEAQKEVDALRGKFNKVSKLLGQRDIGKLASAKPRLIERIIDKGTDQSFRCFELLSGASHTKEELDAAKPSQLNKACPTVANPNYIGN